jgi:hypothetical protein
MIADHPHFERAVDNRSTDSPKPFHFPAADYFGVRRCGKDK